MIAAGLGSSFWIGLLSAILSGVATVLVFRLFESLGQTRAMIGAASFAFTPMVFLASVSAMDTIWGAVFFLAATLCLLHHRIWWCSLFLGLAIASRPTYVLAVIPLILLYVKFEPRRLGNLATWRRLLPAGILAGVVAAVFFAPAVISLRARILEVAPVGENRWIRAAYLASVELFGVLGFFAVCAAAASALIRRRDVHASQFRASDRWAFTLIAIWGALFLALPHDSAYLLPALIGLYWLLCEYASSISLSVMAVVLALSCFVLRIDVGGVSVAGPAFWNIELQEQRTCVGRLVAAKLRSNPQYYVIAGFLKPQVIAEAGQPLSDRVLYAVRQRADGQLLDTELVPISSQAELWVIDQVAEQQNSIWRDTSLTSHVIVTNEC
ncbi:hypothetical protein [Mycolicibacterium sp.]|uniref:hypothetical protein n=1 Tax=Mycolicibacterium sp. TaxID=2320850 RepID=UPI001A1C611B|nr:hypothetical protein [Mycolicibacterium sp.]MBJ7336722.1 hypothetical protein [Mycolicibacterium sp.]